jgi:hypothetical protein
MLGWAQSSTPTVEHNGPSVCKHVGAVVDVMASVAMTQTLHKFGQRPANASPIPGWVQTLTSAVAHSGLSVCGKHFPGQTSHNTGQRDWNDGPMPRSVQNRAFTIEHNGFCSKLPQSDAGTLSV